MFSHIRAQNAAQKGTKCSAKLRKNYEPRRFHAANKSFLNMVWAAGRSTVNSQRSTVKETKRRRDKETKRQREEETKRQRDKETKRGRDRGRKRVS